MLRDRPDDEDVFAAVRETVIGLLALDNTPVEETRLQARLMIDAPSLMGRVYEHYVEFEEIIARAVADRYGLDADRDAYPRLLSTCAMTAVRVALVLWYERGEKEPLADVVTELFAILEVAWRRPRCGRATGDACVALTGCWRPAGAVTQRQSRPAGLR